MKKIYFILVTLLSLEVTAAVKYTATTNIVSIEAYSEYGGGDIIFSVADSESSCSAGYWLRKSDPGFDANLSMLLSTYHSQAKVIIRGHDDRIWGGSSNSYCHLYSIKTVK